MPVTAAKTIPTPTRLHHYRRAQDFIASADALTDLAADTKDPKEAERLEKQADRLVARAHVHAVLSTVDRQVAQ